MGDAFLRFDLLLGVGDGVGEAFFDFGEAVAVGVGVGCFAECLRCLAEVATSTAPNKITRIRSHFIINAVVFALLSGDSNSVAEPDAPRTAHAAINQEDAISCRIALFKRIPPSKFSRGKFSLGECARQSANASPMSSVSMPRIPRPLSARITSGRKPDRAYRLCGLRPYGSLTTRFHRRGGFYGSTASSSGA